MLNLLKNALKSDSKKTTKMVDGKLVEVKEWPYKAVSDPSDWGRSGYDSLYGKK